MEFDEANLQETLRGLIVLTIGSSRRTDDEIFAGLSPDAAQEVSARLGALHRAKIDLADEVLVVDPGGYVGASTREEIDHARQQGKPVRFWSAESLHAPRGSASTLQREHGQLTGRDGSSPDPVLG